MARLIIACINRTLDGGKGKLPKDKTTTQATHYLGEPETACYKPALYRRVNIHSSGLSS